MGAIDMNMDEIETMLAPEKNGQPMKAGIQETLTFRLPDFGFVLPKPSSLLVFRLLSCCAESSSRMANLRREACAAFNVLLRELLQNLFRNIVHPAVVFEQTKSRLTDTNQVCFHLGSLAGQLNRWPVPASPRRV
jgi:hypothetical protein